MPTNLDAGQSGQIRSLLSALTITMGGLLPAILIGTLAPILRSEIGLGADAVGLLLAVFFGVSGLFATFSGRLVDRVGWPGAIRLASIVGLVSLLGIAFGPAGLGWLSGFMVIGGIGLSIGLPAGTVAIAREIPARHRGLVFGFKQTAVPVSGLLAGASLPAVALTVGWRWTFAGAALFPIMAASMIPRDVTVNRQARKPGSHPPPPALRLLSLGGAGAALAISSMLGFITLSAVEAGFSEGAAGILAATASAAGLVARIIAGWAMDRTGSRGFRPASFMMAVGALGLVLLAVHVPVSVVIGAVVGYGVGWGWSPLFQYGAVIHHPAGPGAAVGQLQVGLSIGGAIGPLVFGVLVERLGFQFAWGAAAVMMLLGAFVVWLGARRLPPPARIPFDLTAGAA